MTTKIHEATNQLPCSQHERYDDSSDTEENDEDGGEALFLQFEALEASQQEDDAATSDHLESTLSSLAPSSATSSERETTPELLPLKYNPLHDLESIFWLGLYVLFVGCLVREHHTAQHVLAAQTIAKDDFAVQLFRDPTFRLDIIRPNVLCILQGAEESFPESPRPPHCHLSQ